MFLTLEDETGHRQHHRPAGSLHRAARDDHRRALPAGRRHAADSGRRDVGQGRARSACRRAGPSRSRTIFAETRSVATSTFRSSSGLSLAAPQDGAVELVIWTSPIGAEPCECAIRLTHTRTIATDWTIAAAADRHCVRSRAPAIRRSNRRCRPADRGADRRAMGRARAAARDLFWGVGGKSAGARSGGDATPSSKSSAPASAAATR